MKTAMVSGAPALALALALALAHGGAEASDRSPHGLLPRGDAVVHEAEAAPAREDGSGRPDICALPLETGPCRAYIRRWGYDRRAGRCVQFIYGGCRGNQNRFISREACENFCAPRG